MSENLKVGQLQPVYPAKEHENMRALLDFAVEEYGDDTAFILKKKPFSALQTCTSMLRLFLHLRSSTNPLP
jgi:hypothetical protein